MPPETAAPKPGYELEFEDNFEGDSLDESRWLPYYLPHWSSRARTAPRYELRDGCLRLLIDADHEPWSPEFDGDVRVSAIQTGLFAGPLGSKLGQGRFNPELVVREEQENVRLYTPHHGYFEIRMKALDDPVNMVALWMIGYEDEPERSGEICICEIFGRDVGADHARVGMGLRQFEDPHLVGDFAAERVDVDARDFHVYAAEWTPERVEFFVDGETIKTVEQSPTYPMQFMLGIYEFREPGAPPPDPAGYPKEFVVDYVRGWRRAA